MRERRSGEKRTKRGEHWFQSLGEEKKSHLGNQHQWEGRIQFSEDGGGAAEEETRLGIGEKWRRGKRNSGGMVYAVVLGKNVAVE